MQATEKASSREPAARALRAAGVLYLVLVVTSIFGLAVTQSVMVANDATVTAANILSSETLFRLAMVSELTATIAFVFLARELYRILKGVNKSWASLMVVLVLLSVPISFVGVLSQVAALRLIHGPAVLGLGISQTNGVAMFFLGLSSDTSALNSIFFGLWLLPFGLLVIKSGFIPRILGFLLLVSGSSYLAGSLNFLLSPPFRPAVSAVATVGYAGELAVVVWLVVKAVQVQLSRPDSPLRSGTSSNSNLEGGKAW